MSYFLVAIWSDGTWCFEEDLDFYLSFMSDDFEYKEFSLDELENM